MIKIIDLLWTFMILVALIEFISNPMKAMEGIEGVIKAPSPRITNGRLIFPGNRSKHAKKPRKLLSIKLKQEHDATELQFNHRPIPNVAVLGRDETGEPD